jgi:hypothetical protein
MTCWHVSRERLRTRGNNQIIAYAERLTYMMVRDHDPSDIKSHVFNVQRSNSTLNQRAVL